MFGIANLVGLITVSIIMAYAFSSIWCAYAAVMSMIVYFHFRRRRHMEPIRYPLTD